MGRYKRASASSRPNRSSLRRHAAWSSPSIRSQKESMTGSLGLAVAAQELQHLFGMGLGVLHRLPVLLHLAVRADDDRRADRPLHLFAVHHLFPPRAVGAHRLSLRVGQQREVQPIPFAEFLVRLEAVFADAEDHRARFLDVLLEVAKAARLLGASRRVVLGIKVEHHRFALVVLQPVLFPVAALQVEIGRFVSFQAHPSTSSYLIFRENNYMSSSRFL